MKELFESLNPHFDEDKESRREDSVCEINRLREEAYSEIELLVDKQVQLSVLSEEIESIKSSIGKKTQTLQCMVNDHLDKYNETV